MANRTVEWVSLSGHKNGSRGVTILMDKSSKLMSVTAEDLFKMFGSFELKERKHAGVVEQPFYFSKRNMKLIPVTFVVHLRGMFLHSTGYDPVPLEHAKRDQLQWKRIRNYSNACVSRKTITSPHRMQVLNIDTPGGTRVTTAILLETRDKSVKRYITENSVYVVT